MFFYGGFRLVFDWSSNKVLDVIGGCFHKTLFPSNGYPFGKGMR